MSSSTFELTGILQNVTEGTTKKGAPYPRFEIHGTSGKGQWEKEFNYPFSMFNISVEQVKQMEGSKVRLSGFIEPYIYESNGVSRCKPDLRAFKLDLLEERRAESRQMLKAAPAQQEVNYEDDDIPF
jgi:hypothetical protein